MGTLYFTDSMVLGKGYMTPKDTIEGANPDIPKYPLLPGDGLRREGSKWRKDFEGACVGGFIIEDESLLEPYDDYHARRLAARNRSN